MLSLILIAATTPVPTPNVPTLRPGLTEDQVTPGLLGFVVTFSIVAIMFFVIRDMMKRVRRVRYRAQVESGIAGGSHGPNAEYMGIPIRDDATISGGAPLPVPVETSASKTGPSKTGGVATDNAADKSAT